MPLLRRADEAACKARLDSDLAIAVSFGTSGELTQRCLGTPSPTLLSFELKAHDWAEADEGLSGRKFTEAYFDLLKRYPGPAIRFDPAYGNEWAFIPHFYNSFYVYQYASCIAAATYFTRATLKGGAKGCENFLSVLKAGGSDYPVDIPRRAGARFGIANAVSGADRSGVHRLDDFLDVLAASTG